MSTLFEVVEKMQDTEAAMVMAERAVAQHPDSPTLAISMKSIEKRRRELEEEFSEVARQNVLDVCSYRVFTESGDNIKISSFARALGNFQSLFSTVYDALKNGPKVRAKLDAAVTARTAFDFGYCFSGSAGIVMTMPDELLLLGETDLDKTTAAIFEMVHSVKPEQIAKHAKTVGVASVRKLYQWVADHVEAGAGADIGWRKGNELKLRLFAQLPQMETLRGVIAATSEETEETLEMKGTLVGLDVETRRFHIKFDGDAEDIKGDMSPAIGTRQTLEVPKPYTVEVLVKKRINYSTEIEEVSYFLLKIKEG